MEQLQLKEIVGYLPNGVKAYVFDEVSFLEKYRRECPNGEWAVTLTFSNFKEHIFKNGYKPILFPISSLTEFREDLGFVPIEKLGYGEEKDLAMTLMFDKNELVELPYRTIQKLYEWKIDIHSLIEKGLAIEVTEEFNPYL